MRSLILAPLILFASCQEEEMKLVDQNDTGPAHNTCNSITELNTESDGEQVKITASFGGCYGSVVMRTEVRTPNDEIVLSYRQKPSACDRTEDVVQFGRVGETLRTGLFPCGSEPEQSGKKYTLTIVQGSHATSIDGKIGSVVKYTIQ